MGSFLDKYEKIILFTPDEAWKLYRYTAFAEAFGWSSLILAIVLSHYNIINSSIALPIGGQIHGTIFIAYFIILIAVYPSLEWNRTISLFALLSGVPPYGSLLFEIWANNHRNKHRTNKLSIVAIILNRTDMIVSQPSHGIGWQLPTIMLQSKEDINDGIQRLLKTYFGIAAEVNNLGKLSSTDSYYFTVNDPIPFFKLDLSAAADKAPLVDELMIINKNDSPEMFTNLLPDSLR